MRILVLLALSLITSFSTFAQNKTRLYETYFSNPDAMIEDEENGGYYFIVGDSLKVSMSDDGYYKLMTQSGVVLEEGDTDEADDKFERHGKWTENYNNGKTKTIGNYYHNQPFGQWTLYNIDGSLSAEYNILVLVAEDGNTAYCKAGVERIYYNNGKIKEERFFKAEPIVSDEQVRVEDPETGKQIMQKIKVKSFRAKPFGTWIYYNNDGTEVKREDK